VTLALLAGGVAGCATSTPWTAPGFQRLTVTSVQPDVERLSVTLTAVFTFRYVNPLSVAIPVPTHTFGLYLDGSATPAASLTKPGFTVPPNATAHDIPYPVSLVIGGPGSLATQYLGRDVPYRFLTTFTLPALPGVPPRQVQIAHDDSLRLPLFPQLSVAGLPSLQLLGTIRTLDVRAFRQPMVEVGDVLVRFLGPILDAFLALGTLAGGDQTALRDPDKREAFTRGWTRFKEDIPDRILDLPASRLEGIRLEVPVRVRNPNRFPIHAPTVSVSLTEPGAGAGAAGRVGLVALVYPNTAGAAARIPEGPGTSREATLVVELRWTRLAGGSANPLDVLRVLDGSGSATLALRAEFAMDLGYGLVTVPLEIPLQPLRLNP
jgi:hypothetical protein